jgi:hypothetical protein
MTVILVCSNVTPSIKMLLRPDTGRSANPTHPSLGSPVVDELTKHPSPAMKSRPTKLLLCSIDKGITQLTYHVLFPLLVFFLTIFYISISSSEPPPKMRRQSS